VLNGRYEFQIYDGNVRSFEDRRHNSHSFVGKDEQCDALASMTNLLTLENVLALARDKIHKLGMDEKELGLGEPVKLTQWRYDSNGVVHPLPLYAVRWNSDHVNCRHGTIGDRFNPYE